MKKLLSVILVLVILCASAVALAEESTAWTCPNCGKESEGNFCSWCGTAKPKPVVVCANCGAEYDSAMGYLYCSNCGASLAANPDVSGIAVGDIISFGHYEQDNVLANGPEAIEWIVLDVQDGKAFLLSKYALDVKLYNTERVNTTWEQCTLRTWLNQDFLKAAFDEKEQSAILTTHVDNSRAQGYSVWDTSGGNDTEDQIFLLSDHEALDLYFTSDEDRMCALTDYAMANGAYYLYFQQDGRPTGAWWLRSPGESQDDATIVNNSGFRYFNHVQTDDNVVRPALWINLESGII